MRKDGNNYTIIRMLIIGLMCSMCSFTPGCRKRVDESALLMPLSGEETLLPTGEALTEAIDEAETAEVSEPPVVTTILVHVCGAVQREGVYELPTGSRVIDAIDSAGGLTGDAAGEAVNQASVLQDGMKVRIPTKEELETSDGAVQQKVSDVLVIGSGPVEVSDGRININTATVEELSTLPGIGAARAQKIIDYREQHGGFAVIEDIMKVSGIKEKAFAQLKDLIKV